MTNILGAWRDRRLRAALAVLGAVLLAALALAAPAWAGLVRSNPAVITINDGVAATPYPSTINVTGFPSTNKITDLDVTLHGVSHTFPSDLDILLEGPGGQKVMLMSDAGSSGDLNNTNLTFDDDPAPVPSGPITGHRFSPTNYGSPDNMPAPAPAEPYATALSVFDGAEANGAYKLYVRDDAGGDVGQIAGGWSLDITAPPPNDAFANAQAINSSSATITGDNISATKESGEPQFLGGFSDTGGSAWYRWTAPGTGPTNIDTCTTTYDGLLGIYTGSAVNSLTAVAAGNFNGCPSGFGDKTTFDAQAGTTYHILVGGCCGAPQGSFALNLSGPANTPPAITPISPRPNSQTRDRTPLISATVADTATNLAAADIRLFVDGRARPFSYDAATDRLSYTSSRLTYAKHTVRIDATDAHGGTATRSWSFKVVR